jgi:uncharacterized protein (TIGR03437 family)
MRLTIIWPMALLGATLAHAATPPAYDIQTVAGSSLTGDGGPATAAQLGNIQGVATDRLGNVYLSDTDNHRVRKVSSDGIITTIAGTGTAGFSGDGGPAAAAQFNLPYGLATDLAGNLYVADLGNNRVRRIAPDGTIATVAGGGVQAVALDGSPATGVSLLTPRNVTTDAAGNLYVSEFSGHRVRKVTADGKIWTAAGTGIAGFWGDGGLAVNAQLAFPAGLAVDRNGNLYIADSQNQRIRKILPGNVMSTVLGGSPSTRLFTPIAVAVDGNTTIYAGDSSDMVHSYTLAGVWSDAAGTGAAGYWGDGGPATAAQLAAVRDLAVDLTGTVYIADGVRVRSVDPSLIIHTVAGDGYLHAVGDGGPATSAQLYRPSAIVLDYSGNLFVADTGTQRVRQVTPSGIIVTVAGTGIAGYNGDQGQASSALLNSPGGVALDAAGGLVVADTVNQRIRKVSGGVISTVLGTGIAGSGPQNTAPLQTPVRSPGGVCFDLGGNLYVADTLNNRVLQAPPGALVATAAGNGAAGSLGDGGPAPTAQLDLPDACAADAAGNLYVADTGNHRIRKVTAAGIVSTVAGTGAQGGAGDEGPATSAALSAPRGVAVDGSGNVYIADTGNNRIRMVTPDGIIHNIAGTSAAGFAGDGGAALPAQLDSPAGLLVDGSGDVYVADSGNNRIRRLTPLPASPPVTPVQPSPPPAAVVLNAATMAAGTVAPGELVTIAGTGLGPQSGVAGLFDSAGLVANLVAGTEVDFDGVAAPVFYTQYSQVTVQVPYTVAGNGTTQVAVRYLGQTAATATVPVADAAPGLFPQVLNQDGSANTASNPAPQGSTAVLYATGEGLRNGGNVAGLPAAAPYANPLQPVVLTIGGAMASIAFSGAAPGQVGVLQVNAVVPGNLPSGQVAVMLAVGTASSPVIAMWVR